MNKLFFDISISGHHLEYLSHLINSILTSMDDKYYFIVHPSFSKHSPDLCKKVDLHKNIHIIEVTSNEFDRIHKSPLMKASFESYRIMNQYAIRYNIDQVILLYFNVFQLSTIFFRPKYSISGILFFPLSNNSDNFLYRTLKYLKKYLIIKSFLFNSRIKNIFILEDAQIVNFLNKEFKTSVFKILRDPIPNLSPLKNFDIKSHYGIHKNNKVFLHFGSLSDRKGTFEIIDSIYHLPDGEKKQMTFIFVGKAVDSLTEDLILSKIKKIQKSESCQIIWDNQFVSNEMMKSLFNQSDVIVMTYKDNQGSSGILGHAAISKKILIATNEGLIGRLVNEFNLGILVNKVDPKEISGKILESINFKIDFKKSKSFVKHKSPKSFTSTILENLKI